MARGRAFLMARGRSSPIITVRPDLVVFQSSWYQIFVHK